MYPMLLIESFIEDYSLDERRRLSQSEHESRGDKMEGRVVMDKHVKDRN